jgi:hypothetical protein
MMRRNLRKILKNGLKVKKNLNRSKKFSQKKMLLINKKSRNKHNRK